jgi:predicted nucleotidyltransferase
MTPDALVAIRDLQAIVAATGHHIVLIGAYAREITFDRAIGIRSQRATRDIDAAVRIAGWAEFERLATEIVTTATFRRTERDGLKFVHRNGTEVDLLPFGGITGDDATLRWPDDPTRTMTLAGFGTLDERAVDADLGGVILPVADLCDLVALKLFAFNDRADRTTKDLEDLVFILEHATDALHDRAFKELDSSELIAQPYEEYGALLLGHDLRVRFDGPTRERLVSIARRAARRVPSLPALHRGSSSDQPDALDRRFAALEAGLLATDG